MKKIIKNNLKIILAFVVGVILTGTITYASVYYFQSNEVGYNNSVSGLNATNVQDAITELYGRAQTVATGLNTCNSNYATCQASLEALQECTTSPFHLGDYVRMTPTASTWTPPQAQTNSSNSAITPNELSLWRVININNDCTVEMVSEYVSSTNVRLYGKTGYVNYIDVLLQAAKQYANTTYTLDPSTAPDGAFRIVGYNGQTKIITDTTKINDTTLGSRTDGQGWNYSISIETNEAQGGGDNDYGRDLSLLSKAGVDIIAYKYNTTERTGYFLASRRYFWGSSEWDFLGRIVDDRGAVGNGYLILCYPSGSCSDNGSRWAFRPIVTLKSGLTPSGNGTKASPWNLS